MRLHLVSVRLIHFHANEWNLKFHPNFITCLRMISYIDNRNKRENINVRKLLIENIP